MSNTPGGRLYYGHRFSTVWRNDQPTSTQPTEGVGAWQFIQHQLKELVHAAMQPEQVEVIKRDAAKEWENKRKSCESEGDDEKGEVVPQPLAGNEHASASDGWSHRVSIHRLSSPEQEPCAPIE